MRCNKTNFASRGIQWSVHWTFILVVIWFVSVNLISGFHESGWIWSLIMVICLLASIFIHDMAQAIAAVFFKIEINHLILLPIGGLPSISKKPGKRRYECLMLAAGPLANLLIAGTITFFLRPYAAYWNEPENIGVGYDGNFLFQLQFINLSLGMLNLLPVFPMDGGRVLDTLLEKKISMQKAARIVNIISVFSALGFLISGIITMKYSLLLIGLFIVFTIPLGRYYHPLKKRMASRIHLNKA